MIPLSEQDKHVQHEKVEQRKGVMNDVALPVTQTGAGGAAAGAANAWLSNKLGGGQKQPPPKKDN